jgi:hypothetical protein
VHVRRLPISAGILAGILVAAPNASAQTSSQPTIHIEFGNWDLRRHVELVAAGADVVHAATEAALGKTFDTVSTSRDRRGRLFRLGKLYVVDFPMVAVAHTLGHEYGHASRHRAYQIYSAGFRLDNFPWPVPFVNGSPKPGSSSEGAFDARGLGLVSGGYEAGRVRDRRFADEFGAPGGVDHSAAARLIYSRLEEPLAALVYLRESKIRDQNFFLGLNTSAGPDDMVVYSGALTAVRYGGRISTPDAQSAAREIRRGARWALADLQLLGSFYRVANYLWTGNATGEVPAITVRGSRFWPRATFALTPVGIARGGEVLWVRDGRSATLHLERTEQAAPLDVTAVNDRGRPLAWGPPRSLWGGGLSVSAPVSAMRIRLEGNVWNQEATGRGGSVEGRVERSISALAPRTSANVSLGYKSAGFLAGAPDAARWFASAGVSIR